MFQKSTMPNMSITSSRRTNFATVFMIVAIFLFASFRSGESNHPNRFVPGNDYYHLHESDISGYNCPGGSKVNQRAPKASTACPAGSDPAVVIKWGYVGQKPSTGTSSGIFQSFGKTNMRVHRNKRLCSSEAGNFHTGEPDDPYPLLTLAQGSDAINRMLKNKKVVQAWGHAMGVMCSRGRPRVRLTLNADDDERRTIMPNTWTDEENALGSAEFTFQPPCLEKDGSNGHAGSYDGRLIEYNHPGGSKTYGLCSMADRKWDCHHSPDFDTGSPVVGDHYTVNDGLKAWNPAGVNTFKLELHCGDDVGTSVFAAGVGSDSCTTTQQHWILRSMYTYFKAIQVYRKQAGWACRCGQPRSHMWIGGSIGGYDTTRSAIGRINTNSVTELCPAVSGYPQCHIGHGAGTSGCASNPQDTIGRYVSITNPKMLKCQNGPIAGSYVDYSVVKARRCSSWSTQPLYSHQYEGCPKWTDPGRGNDYRIFINGRNQETDITRNGHGPRKTGDYQSGFSYISEHVHSGWGYNRFTEHGGHLGWWHGNGDRKHGAGGRNWHPWGPVTPVPSRYGLPVGNAYHYHKYTHTSNHRSQYHYITGRSWWSWSWATAYKNDKHMVGNGDTKKGCYAANRRYKPGKYRVLLGTQKVCTNWVPQHYQIRSRKDYRQGIKYEYLREPTITHHWTATSKWELQPAAQDNVVFPIAAVEITLCTKEWTCPPGTWKDGSSCVKCAAGTYRRAKDPELNGCKQCSAGYIEKGSSALRDDDCQTMCPAGSYCLAGAFEGSSAKVRPCPQGRYCSKGSSSDESRCHAGFVCYQNSIDGQGRAKPGDEPRKCEAGYFCAAGSHSTKQRQCQAGYYCPRGTTTQIKCSDDAKERFSKYCLVGQSVPKDIPDGFRGKYKQNGGGLCVYPLNGGWWCS